MVELGWLETTSQKKTKGVLILKLKDLVVGTTTTPQVHEARAPQKAQKESDASVEKVVVEKSKDIKKVPRTKAHANMFIPTLGRDLRQTELWFGDPGTGKTTQARTMFEAFKERGVIEDYVVVNAQEELTVMSLFKTAKTDEQGTWRFLHNKLFQMLTDTAQSRYGVIIDEFNTLPMSVMKSLQPIIDDTEGDFVFEDKTYTKNPNVHFVFTMNHNDMGISQLPVAIKDRVYPTYFPPLSTQELAKRSGVKEIVIEKLRRIRRMFAHLGDLPEFHKSVRQLKALKDANASQVKLYVMSQLALANVDYEEALELSPEFEDFLKEFDEILGGGE